MRQVAAIEAGEEDPRRYNVSELLEAGHIVAAEAPESELDERSYVGLVPHTVPATFAAADDDLQKLRVSLRDRNGEAPDGSWVPWAARDGSDFGSIPIEDYGYGDGDTATAELRHPRGAKFVSVRMTATDDAGTEVEHTTIRAYGLE